MIGTINLTINEKKKIVVNTMINTTIINASVIMIGKRNVAGKRNGKRNVVVNGNL
jgi:hypothetical protein